ncbi:hypothetical protein REPUB_Repub19eG0124100 [Reevesia pubescens]
MTAKDKIDAGGVEGLDPFVRKIRNEKYGWKYGCGAKGCIKLFHAVDSVHKHLTLKHPELVIDLTSKAKLSHYSSKATGCSHYLYLEQPPNHRLASSSPPISHPSSTLREPEAKTHKPSNPRALWPKQPPCTTPALHAQPFSATTHHP